MQRNGGSDGFEHGYAQRASVTVLAALVAGGLFLMLAVSGSSNPDDCSTQTTDKGFADCVHNRDQP